MTDEDEEEAEVDQDQRFPLFSKPKAQRHDFSCNHQEESSESSESSDSKIRSNVTSASSANTSNKQAVLGAHSQRSVGARRGQLCFRLAVAAISWSASILFLMGFEVKLLIRSDTEGSTVCVTRWLMFSFGDLVPFQPNGLVIPKQFLQSYAGSSRSFCWHCKKW